MGKLGKTIQVASLVFGNGLSNGIAAKTTNVMGNLRWVLVIAALVAARAEDDPRWFVGLIIGSWVVDRIWLWLGAVFAPPTINFMN